MNKIIKYIILAGVVLLIILSVGKAKGWFGKKGNAKKVFTEKVTRVNIIETVTGSGKIQPEKEVKISSDVSGEIIELPVKEGQQVKKGDLLVKINPDLYQSGLERAKASVNNAKASLEQAKARLVSAQEEFERSKSLYEKGIISKADYQKADTNYKVAKATYNSAKYSLQSAYANLKEAKDNLLRTTIYSPISGTISALNVETGERVVGTKQMTGTEIMRIANLNNMEAVVDINENDIVKIKVGDSANVEVDAYMNDKFKGVITEIANSAQNKMSSGDEITNFQVKIRLLEDSYKHLLEGKPKYYSPFRPGMTAAVDIITNVKKDVIGVPISAVTIRKDTSTIVVKKKDRSKLKKKENSEKDKVFEVVFLAKDGKAKLQVVKTGIQDDNHIEIKEGLKEGDEIITGPYNLLSKRLKNGDIIEVSK
jgi:HlyD family secretion protein